MDVTNKKRNKEIRIMLSEEEYQIAQEKAKEAGLKVAPYIRKSALRPEFVEYKYWRIKHHTHYLKKMKNNFFEFAKRIFMSMDYRDEDVESAWEIMQFILKSEQDFFDDLKKRLRKQKRRKRLEVKKYEK